MLAFLLPRLAAAATPDSVSIGQFATQLMEPVSVLSDFVSSAAIIIGIACLFAGFFRYMQYRVNPLASPISTVIVLIILGIVLLCLPFLNKLTGEGIPFPHDESTVFNHHVSAHANA